MALMEIVVWSGITLVIGGSVGASAAKIASYHLRKQDKKKLLEVVEGKKANNLKIDGEIINVMKFTYKRTDGELIKDITLKEMAKKDQPVPLNEQKTTFLNKLLIKFWKRKQGKKVK